MAMRKHCRISCQLQLPFANKPRARDGGQPARQSLLIRIANIILAGSPVSRKAGCENRRATSNKHPLKPQAYLLFGDEQFLRMFAEAYASAMGTMQLIGEYSALGWLVDVHAGSGRISRVWISSLAAFWPGMQALIGARPCGPGNVWETVSGNQCDSVALAWDACGSRLSCSVL
jgi:hypothetical protein